MRNIILELKHSNACSVASHNPSQVQNNWSDRTRFDRLMGVIPVNLKEIKWMEFELSRTGVIKDWTVDWGIFGSGRRT